jgi:RNA ligase
MVNLYDVVPEKELLDNIVKGYVRHQTSPDGTRALFNYTNKAQYDNEWNDATRKTRGLIIDTRTEKVVSRPFEKFFNWSQIPVEEQARLMNKPVDTYEKWDGSLGILYGLHTGEHRIATRGSFTSPQALHATEVLQTRYPTFEPILGLTYLFEIVYPQNRIVVNYQSMDDLVLIAVIDTATGKTLPKDPYDWPGPWNAPVGYYATLAEVLAAPQETNQEGFVVHFPESDLRVKWKFDEYVRLHRIMTNVSTLSVWDALANGQGIESWIDHVPDEFYTWVHQQVYRLEGDYNRAHADAVDEYEWIKKRVRRPEWDKDSRKEFALLAQESEYKDVLFGLLDGKDISERLWKRVRPVYDKPYSGVSEDVA